MNLAPGNLQQLWCVRCIECKAAKPLEGPVTRHGAVMTLENSQWALNAKGHWVCVNCRSAGPKR